MTIKSTGGKSSADLIKSTTVFISFVLIAFFLSGEISGYVLESLSFSLTVLIPSIFPFMVLSDFASAHIEFQKQDFLASYFEKIFKINKCAISAFAAGILGGFPIGAKNAISLLNDGIISKDECERLLSFSNIPGIAYVTSAIGIGMLNDLKLGITLYFITLISAVFCGFILGTKKKYTSNCEYIQRQNYDFVKSVKNSAIGCINIISFVSFFSVISSFIINHSISSKLTYIIIPFIEVGNAVRYMSESCIFSSDYTVAGIAFSLSFSGFSVIMQSLSFASDSSKISTKKCVLYKLFQGVVAVIITLFFYKLENKTADHKDLPFCF